jgi:cellulose synthase/poly-beta-1,6-N-acetylglucosamine synthase-like glycosyltransferase
VRQLPHHIQVVTVPAGTPRTKPRALNLGLLAALGSFIAVFDAEDRPETNQLRAALTGFVRGGPDLACVQARLVIDNTADGWLTRIFTLEYAGLFDALLPGLARCGLMFPLGGTSNHFRTEALERVGGWDAWNVTEDADLGVRLARFGYRSEMIASSTFEEAPNTFSVWLRQRTRWLKGYVLTWVVHMRRPVRLFRELGWRNFAVFQASVGGVAISALMLPIFVFGVAVHSITGIWFVRGDWADRVLFFLEATNLVIGFGAAVALAGLGARRRGLNHLVAWLPSVPFYWMLSSVAIYRAIGQLITTPHLWEKTEHGLARTSRTAQTRRRSSAAISASGRSILSGVTNPPSRSIT